MLSPPLELHLPQSNSAQDNANDSVTDNSKIAKEIKNDGTAEAGGKSSTDPLDSAIKGTSFSSGPSNSGRSSSYLRNSGSEEGAPSYSAISKEGRSGNQAARAKDANVRKILLAEDSLRVVAKNRKCKSDVNSLASASQSIPEHAGSELRGKKENCVIS